MLTVVPGAADADGPCPEGGAGSAALIDEAGRLHGLGALAKAGLAVPHATTEQPRVRRTQIRGQRRLAGNDECNTVPERATNGRPMITVDDVAGWSHRRMTHGSGLDLVNERSGARQGRSTPCAQRTVMQLRRQRHVCHLQTSHPTVAGAPDNPHAKEPPSQLSPRWRRV
jgi:hypothetical protein